MRAWQYTAMGAVVLIGVLGLYLKPPPARPSSTTHTTQSPAPKAPAIKTTIAPPEPGPPGAPTTTAEPPHDDAALIQKIRNNVKKDPALAVSLVYRARRIFPASRYAEERDALVVDALINLQRIGAARDEAERYLERYPRGRYATYIFAMTGAFPRPQGPR
jgi:hypothetical protein